MAAISWFNMAPIPNPITGTGDTVEVLEGSIGGRNYVAPTSGDPQSLLDPQLAPTVNWSGGSTWAGLTVTADMVAISQVDPWPIDTFVLGLLGVRRPITTTLGTGQQWWEVVVRGVDGSVTETFWMPFEPLEFPVGFQYTSIDPPRHNLWAVIPWSSSVGSITVSTQISAPNTNLPLELGGIWAGPAIDFDGIDQQWIYGVNDNASRMESEDGQIYTGDGSIVDTLRGQISVQEEHLIDTYPIPWGWRGWQRYVGNSRPSVILPRTANLGPASQGDSIDPAILSMHHMGLYGFPLQGRPIQINHQAGPYYQVSFDFVQAR